MAIIVEDTRTGGRGILLGAANAMFRSATPGIMGSERIGQGQAEQLAVCDKTGTVFWLDMLHARVISVDGAHPQDVLIED